MYARRHPFLFFLIIIVICSTIMFSGFVLLLSFGSRMVSSGFIRNNASSHGNVGIVEINGIILSSKKIIQNIRTFRDDDSIKAIILRIDSPGGGIGPSQEIYREVMKTKRDKKSKITNRIIPV